jgi:hypothetical protein
MSENERAVLEAARVWAAAYRARWDGMMGGDEPDPRIEADATLALVRAVDALVGER